MRMLNRILALVLVLSLGVGLLPTEGITAWIAEAEAQRSIEATVVAKDHRALLAEADAQVEMGRTRASGGWRYVAVDGGRYAAVVGYDGEAEAQLAVPELLGGMDVVAIGAGALASLAGLEALSVPGNVRVIGAGALPRGAAVKALNASYALAWAAQNGHAGINASEYDFHAGVVDLSDVREENFVRVSANEVWLRGLEASRLAVGKRFFLVDPGNAYQISYYEVLSSAEGPDGFVVFRCATPEVDEVLDYYRFTSWLDEDGNAIGESFQTDEDSPSEIHFYANWEPSGETTAAEASDTYIGTIQYNDADYIPADPAEAFSYSLLSSGIRINGLNSDYSFSHLRIPEKIGDEFVTSIDSQAFKGDQSLVSVSVPSSVSYIG